jgi:translation initiation factor IF-1
MSKEELIQFEGLVTESLPDGRYRVQLDAGHNIVAYTAGRMEKNRIKTLPGDCVTTEMSPYDHEKGRLIFRHKDERPARADARRCAINSGAADLFVGHRHATARKGPSHANLHVQVGNEAAVARFCR